ncbi:hypothetical protein AWC38_SpisGene4907 [Stylophora pistillata]|uniref:Uncharacterized protein n=1 Tax=Stylophora pistillata TaxID=50429 RepID=A0A2B4SP32_STYPI|nr:hypothetical protein AWC38_SpisGene4907 [Stylophora pistillata]
MADMNLTSYNLANESRSNILEFYRRLVVSHGYQLTNSIVGLLRVQKVSTAPAYLTKLKKELRLMKPLITRAVNLDRQLKGLPALGTTAAITPIRSSSDQSQSLSTVACHLKECVLSDLEIWSNEMFIDFRKLKNTS